jgi:WD40 repeat protein
LHARLGDYFHAQDYWQESLEDQQKRAKTLLPTPRTANVRKIQELPWHRLQARQWNELEALLFDLEFMEAKVSSGFVRHLITDFTSTAHASDCARELPDDCVILRHLKLLAKCLASATEKVRADPSSVGSQLHFELQDCNECGADELAARLEMASTGRSWIKHVSSHGKREPAYQAQTAFHGKQIHSLQFSDDGQLLAFANWDGKLTRWGWRQPEASDETQPVAAVGVFRYGAMVSSQRFLVADERDVWLLRTNDLWKNDLSGVSWQRLYSSPEGYRVWNISASATNGYALVAYSSRERSSLLVYRSREDRIVAEWAIPLPDPGNFINHVAITDDDKTKAVVFGRGEILFSNGIQVDAHAGGAFHCEFIHGDTELVSCGDDGTCALWDLQGRLCRRIELGHGSAECLVYCPQKNLLFVGHRNGFVSYLTLSPSAGVGHHAGSFFPGVYGWVLTLAVSKCGSWLAAAGRSGLVRVFDISTVLNSDKQKLLQGLAFRPVRQVSIWKQPPGCFFMDGQHHLLSTLKTRHTSHLPLRCNCWCTDFPRGVVFVATREEIRILRADTGEPIRCHRVKPASRISMALNGDASKLAVLEHDQVKIYRVSPDYSNIIELVAVSLRDFLLKDDTHLPTFRGGLPITFCSDDDRIIVPLESTLVLPLSLDNTMTVPTLEHGLAFVDVSNQIVTPTAVRYNGFCTALNSRLGVGELLVGVGDQYVQTVKQDGANTVRDTFMVESPEPGVLLLDVQTEKAQRFYRSSSADLGVTDLTTYSTTGLLAVAFRSGRVRLASLRDSGWICSVCLDYPAMGIEFDDQDSRLFVADDGAGTASWPVVHEFKLSDCCGGKAIS